eukprot:8364920-Prorocentrum_lima.AAC.1
MSGTAILLSNSEHRAGILLLAAIVSSASRPGVLRVRSGIAVCARRAPSRRCQGLRQPVNVCSHARTHNAHLN